VQARTITVLLTDGLDQGSQKYQERDVAAITRDLLQMETHLIFAMGIGPERQRFQRVFRDMGIPDHCIVTPGADAHAIRSAFTLVSQSVARASQGGALFQQGHAGRAMTI
jgi:hypothetical protein